MARRRNASRRRKKALVATLKITSMMDILTVLLLFLLKSFVADGEIVSPSPGVELPTSESRESLQESVVVAVRTGEISVGGDLVAQWSGDFSPDSPEGRRALDALASRLHSAHVQHEELAAQRGAGALASKVTIQGDRTMPFSLLQEVMLACSQSGYEDIALAVLQG
jgi:biopolymer transport protein ExbD